MVSEIKDGMWGTASGTVGRVGTASNGPFAVIEMKRQGAQYPDRVTAWQFEGVAEGDRVSVEGWISWTVQDKDGKKYVNHSLNKGQLKKHEPAGGAFPTNDDTPF